MKCAHVLFINKRIVHIVLACDLVSTADGQGNLQDNTH